MRKSAWRVVIGAALAGALVMAAPGGAGAAVDTGRVPQVLIGVGSDTTYEGNGSLAKLYNESPGCATIPATGSFTNFEQKCLEGGQLTYASNYDALIETENLYHDMVLEAFPTGSSNGAATLRQVELGNPAIGADLVRSSAKQNIAAVAGRTFFGSAYQRDGLGIWLGTTNKKVAKKPNIKHADANVVWRGDAGGQCFINYDKKAADSIKPAKGAPGAGNIVVFATQAGSGTGRDFARLISGDPGLANASSLANCIPAAFKDGNQNNGERVIFENFAGPICKQTEGAQTKNYRNSAIFPYAFGRFVQNKGAAGNCGGVMAKVNGKAPTAKTIADVSATGYLYGRYNHIYWSLPSPLPGGFNINNPATWDTLSDRDQAVLEYVHPVRGWLCKPAGQHSANPVSGTNYRTLIQNQIKADGFGGLAAGPVGGGTFTGSSHCRDSAST